MDFRTSLEMTINREEFFRLLASLVGPFELNGGTVRWREGNRHRTIRLVRLPPVHLGSVALPHHGVEILLEACSEAQGDAFMSRFRRAFLRGGG
jgi:hypothetical protein